MLYIYVWICIYREIASLRAEVTKLKQQQNDLLSAFKKQFKLIDILKKQKMHIEAARLLNFSEEQFQKTMELQL